MGTQYFVPEALASYIPDTITAQNGITLEEASAEVLHNSKHAKHENFAGLTMSGIILKGDKAALDVIADLYDFDVWREVRVGDKNMQMLTRDGSYSFECENNDMEKMPKVGHELEEIFSAASDYTGYGIHLHILRGPVRQPYPQKRREIHLVVGAVPPGSYERHSHATMCGIPLHQEGHYFHINGPTRGYGVTVCDENEELLGQIVGTTFYLYLPLPKDQKWMFKYANGVNLYKEVFIRMWNAYVNKKEGPEEQTLDLEKYLAYHDQFSKDSLDFADERLRELDEKIAEAGRKYSELLGEKKVILVMHQAFELRDAARQGEISAEAEWHKIVGNPLIAKCVIVENGLQMTTAPIVIEHEGRRYPLDTFTMRLNQSGEIHIWANNPTHPKLVPHPHISLEGLVCFGNVSLVMQKALSEKKRAEVLELALEWLVGGYDPKLALHKIEEWPTEKGSKSDE